MKRKESCSSQFSSKTWLRQCNSILVKVSSSIDDLCRTIVKTKALFQTDDLSRELGHLALTVAVLERSVFAYAMKMSRYRKNAPKALDECFVNSISLPSLHTNTQEETDSSEPKVATQQVGLDAENTRMSKQVWKHPGAVISLLEMMSGSIESVKKSLIVLTSEASLFSSVKVHRKKLANGLTLVYMMYILYNFRRLRLKSFFKIPTLSSIISRCIAIYGVLFTGHWSLIWYRARSLRESHRRLSTLLRFWQLCMSEISREPFSPHQENAASRRDSNVIENATVQLEQKSQIPIPISRWMLDLVGVSNIWHDHIYETDGDLWFLWYTYSILYSSVRIWYVMCNNSIQWYGFPFAIVSAVYYSIRPRLAAATMSTLISSVYSASAVSKAERVHMWPETWLKAFSALTSVSSSRVKLSQIKAAFLFYDNLITTRKRQWSWLWTTVGLGFSQRVSTIRSKLTFWPLRWLCFYCINVLGVGSPSAHHRPNSLIRYDEDKETQDLLKMVTLIDLRKSTLDHSSSVVLYIHGDGWVANFLNSDLTFLSQWSNDCQVPLVLFDRTLKSSSSSSQFTALDQAYHLYKMIDGNAIGLGETPKKIILAGDSIGARIAVALCMKIISEQSEERQINLQIPAGLVLAYPPLNLSMMSTPSRAVFMMDPIVPMSLLNQNGEWSIPELPSSMSSEHSDSVHPSTSFFSPLTASNELLKSFPTTSIMVGSVDPFLDDSVDFAHRLSICGVKCRLKVFQRLPHGFLGFQTIIPRAYAGVELGSGWINAVIRKACE